MGRYRFKQYPFPIDTKDQVPSEYNNYVRTTRDDPVLSFEEWCILVGYECENNLERYVNGKGTIR